MAEGQAPQPWLGTGRRKTAVARVRLFRGSGSILINGRNADEYFVDDRSRNAVRQPLKVTKSLNRFDVKVNVCGGGCTSQAGAVLLGVARALTKADREAEAALRDAGLLTRDSRMKERKKFGKRGARASFQFSKR